MRRLGWMILAFAFIPLSSFAETPLPDMMLYQGKPIHPECIGHFWGGSERRDPIDLAKCSKPEMPGEYKVETKDKDTWYVYEKNDRNGYVRYRYVGMKNGLAYVLYSNWPGGSGVFSGVVGFQRDGDTILLKDDEQGGGDRCHGGIAYDSVTMEDGELVMAQFATPDSLISIAMPDAPENVYQGLASNASSCAAKVFTKGEKIIAIEPDPEFGEDQVMTEEYKPQACFDRLFREARQQKGPRWTMPVLKEFAEQFVSQCTEKK